MTLFAVITAETKRTEPGVAGGSALDRAVTKAYSAPQMEPSGTPAKLITRLMAVVALIVVLWAVGDRLNHWYRKQWHFVPSMQDLAPVD